MKKYHIKFSQNAEKDFSKLQKPTQKKIIEKLTFFEKQKNPISFAIKLTNTKNKYRFRIGNYRAIFAISEDGSIILLTILKIAHRKDIYH